jgi:hypothetical protein
MPESAGKVSTAQSNMPSGPIFLQQSDENAPRIPAHRAGYVFSLRQGHYRTAERPWPAILRVNVSE